MSTNVAKKTGEENPPWLDKQPTPQKGHPRAPPQTAESKRNCSTLAFLEALRRLSSKRSEGVGRVS